MEEGGRGKKKKKPTIRFGDIDVCVKEQAREPGGLAALPGVGTRGPGPCPPPARAHCGFPPPEWKGRLLLEAVNFPPTSRVALGRVSQADRAGFTVGRGKFWGAAGQLSPRGDGRLWGRRHAWGPAPGPTRRPHGEKGASPLGEAQDQREQKKGKKSGKKEAFLCLGTRGNKRREGWKSSPPGGRAERSLSGALLSKRSAPPKKVPKFYYGHCFVPLLKCLQKTFWLLLHSHYRSPTSIWEVMLGLFGLFFCVGFFFFFFFEDQ